MKKLFLFLISGAMGLSAMGQQRQMTMAPAANDSRIIPTRLPAYAKQHAITAHKGTAGGSRWYNYAEYLDTALSYTPSENIVAGTSYLWNDTNSINAYTASPPFAHNTMVSYGSVFHPYFVRPTNQALSTPDSGFNAYELYPGEMKLTASNAYTIDSMQLFGFYEFNAAKYASGYVDTLKVRLVYGNGTSGSTSTDVSYGGYTWGNTTNYGTDTLRFVNIRYDSTENMTTGTTVSATQIYLIDTSKWNDTFANGVMPINIRINNAAGAAAPFSVPAGNMVGVSITFKSGDPNFPAPTATNPFDTVNRGTGSAPWKYSMFRPWLWARGAGTAPTFARWDSLDRNEGLYKRLPNYANGWNNRYVPMWAWTNSATGGPSTLQYPVISWKVNCPSCGTITNTAGVNSLHTISKVSAYPAPADNELNIPFTLSQRASVTVVLSNMLGQVVYQQAMGNVSSGKAVINTAALPSGLYIYSLQADGERMTGRAVITH